MLLTIVCVYLLFVAPFIVLEVIGKMLGNRINGDYVRGILLSPIAFVWHAIAAIINLSLEVIDELIDIVGDASSLKFVVRIIKEKISS